VDDALRKWTTTALGWCSHLDANDPLIILNLIFPMVPSNFVMMKIRFLLLFFRINNCIGELNLKYLLMFLFYVGKLFSHGEYLFN